MENNNAFHISKVNYSMNAICKDSNRVLVAVTGATYKEVHNNILLETISKGLSLSEVRFQSIKHEGALLRLLLRFIYK